MSASMTAAARRELVDALRRRYAAATRQEKTWILTEFSFVSGLHRKSATRVLNAEAEAEPPIKRAGRPRLYDQAVQQGLVTLWEASDRVCGKRLKALLPVLLAALEKHGHLALEPEVRKSLLALSATTMDRLLAPTRVAACGGHSEHAKAEKHQCPETPELLFLGPARASTAAEKEPVHRVHHAILSYLT